jgi:hypothetical protein
MHNYGYISTSIRLPVATNFSKFSGINIVTNPTYGLNVIH